ncbi:MAG: hypothetical protein KZQ94_20955 [Candidatus Thiodiazotropha sp. (ex Troendleina suluensis)]|nr:hypothetical protein [Candidatus Thiodiazotropha sp. (ex Troendleina suluensis)]
MSRVTILKTLIQKMKEATLLSKGAVAEKVLDQAVNILDSQEDRINKIENYIRDKALISEKAE